ncbi:dTMP kinase [Candidatus Wolfebacteria bacterium]|nr:dTMP kinase [Candidatus Wolfebacteria bacterium]
MALGRGRFVVFEGIDGAGKSTQDHLLLRWLRKRGIKAVYASNPSQFSIGKFIRSHLSGTLQINPEALQVLFTADRVYQLERLIIPSLKKGAWVILDRYTLSTLAYGALDIKDVSWLAELNRKCLKPDLTILLRISPEEAMRRIKKERSSKEIFEKKKKIIAVARNYEKLVKRTKNVVVIDGEEAIEKIGEKISSLLMGRFRLYGRKYL